MLRSFCCTGLQLWGADQKGVDHTRIMLLEWLSFLHRYVPVGLLERPDALITDRKVPFAGRDELETLFASPLVDDWRAVASLLLGPERGPLHWKPRHNSYANVDQDAENNG